MQQTFRAFSAFLRFMRKAVWGSATVGALALLVTASAAAAQSGGDYQIGPQDVLTIQVFEGRPRGKYRSRPTGRSAFH